MGFRDYMGVLVLSASLLFGVNSVKISAQSLENRVAIEDRLSDGEGARVKNSVDIFKKNIYITGFGPFLDSDADGKKDKNPTQDVVRYFKSQGYNAEVLEANYRKSTKRLKEIIEKYNPKIIVSTGVSYCADSISLPISANNKYWKKEKRIKKIDKNADEKIDLDSNLVKEICNVWNENGILFRLEEDSGDIECNHLFYQGINLTKDTDIKFYFIHLPRDIYFDKEKLSNLEKAIKLLAVMCK